MRGRASKYERGEERVTKLTRKEQRSEGDGNKGENERGQERARARTSEEGRKQS